MEESESERGGSGGGEGGETRLFPSSKNLIDKNYNELFSDKTRCGFPEWLALKMGKQGGGGGSPRPSHLGVPR